mmetsp:Transcript_98629/g.307218  ORF Transcript_98629/g.307218 Transcript_98629/m.307218 type:complete len:201 (-) Transcript_98629:166-768(-)
MPVHQEAHRETSLQPEHREAAEHLEGPLRAGVRPHARQVLLGQLRPVRRLAERRLEPSAQAALPERRIASMRGAIQRHPKSFYESLLRGVARHNTTMEFFWRTVFAKDPLVREPSVPKEGAQFLGQSGCSLHHAFADCSTCKPNLLRMLMLLFSIVALEAAALRLGKVGPEYLDIASEDAVVSGAGIEMEFFWRSVFVAR